MGKCAKISKKAQYIVAICNYIIQHIVIQNYSKKVLTKGEWFGIIINVVASERRRAKLENDTETIEEGKRRKKQSDFGELNALTKARLKGFGEPG